jgi:hypothetical protein
MQKYEITKDASKVNISHIYQHKISLPKVGIKTLKSNHAGIFILLPGL